MKKLLILLLLLAPSVWATDYVDSTSGAVTQAVGCLECGRQNQSSQIWLGYTVPSNTGYLDSMLVRVSNNYGVAVKVCGVIYNGTSGGVTTLVGRTKDTLTTGTNTQLADGIIRFTPNTLALTASTAYWIGTFTDSTNATTIRIAYTDNATDSRPITNGSSTTVANWTTAGYAFLSAGAAPGVYVKYYYHSNDAIQPSSTVIRGSVIRGSVIR